MITRNSIKNSLFMRSFALAKSNPKKVGLMILFDILFVASFLSLKKLFEYSAKSILLPSNLTGTFFYILFSVIYYLLVLFAYSFFKFCILDSVKSLFGKSGFSLRQFGKFYLLNLVITSLFFVISIFAGMFLINIKPQYQLFFYFIIASPYWVTYNEYSIFSLHSLLFYLVLNLSQSIFYEHGSLKQAVRSGFKHPFTNTKPYSGIIAPMIILGIIFGLLLLGIGYLIRLSSQDYAFYAAAYSYFTLFSKWLAALLVYFVTILNRISFYNNAITSK